MSASCPACGLENPAGHRFCGRCGTRLGIPCAACGSASGPDERFCGNCGEALATSSISSPGRSLPRSSSSRPRTGEPEGERKQLTVLFADVKGSMELQERLDPEVWAGIMGRFASILAEGVRRYGGTIDKFTGDGIMALFGAPLAQEDHARRACHAALALIGSVADYTDELRRSHGLELHIRVGLNSGEAVVGWVGEDVHLDRTAFGHAVGLAQRMESIAEPGRAYLTEQTARLVEGWFRLRDLGPMTVKGAREPLRVFMLETSRLARAVAPGTSRLVGRTSELALLEEALARAADGDAQVVGVVGEAGVGKSRLCEEFAQAVAARGITVRRTTGLSHGLEVPLLPVLALLRDYFGISDADSPEQARERIAERLLAVDSRLSDDAPLLFDFLEVPDPKLPAPPFAAEVRMRRIFEALRRVTAHRSEKEMLVLVAEDLHWFDPQSADFLERMVDSYPGSRTLVVTNFRPEFSAAWMRHSYYRQIPLRPLRDAALAELLSGLLGVDRSLVPLHAFVAERTGGNPFFVEEVVRALIEEGALAGVPGAWRLTRTLDQVRVPPSVHAVLAARIDRLPSDQKQVLQSAAVIGRTFSEAVLARVLGKPDALMDSLTGLCAAELLQEAQRYPVAEYRFWHPLTQEVAYGSLLQDRRRPLHTAVARAIIAIEASRLDERAALIATHFERSGDPLEAARWNHRAGDFALRSDVGEAMRRWRATLVHLESAPESDDALRIGIQPRNRLLRYGARIGMDPDEAGRLYADGRAAAERLQNTTALASIALAYGSTLAFRGRVRDAYALYLESARLSDQTDDAGVRAAHWTPLGLMVTWIGRVSESLQAIERVSVLCAGDASVGVSLMGFSPLSIIGVARAEVLALCGRLEAARAALEEGLAIARERGETEWIAWALSIYPRLARTSEEFEVSLERAHEALRIAEDSGNISNHVLALEAVGIAEVGLGRLPEAVTTLERALAEAREHQVALFEESRALAHLARAHIGMGHDEVACHAAEDAVNVAQGQGARALECLALLTRAQILRVTGGPAEAILADLHSALDLVKETGALAYEPPIHEELARLQKDEDELREALRLYEALGATGDVRRLETELASSEVWLCRDHHSEAVDA